MEDILTDEKKDADNIAADICEIGADTGSDAPALPADVVHCFPASGQIIARRRVMSVLFGIAFLIGTVFFLLPDSRSFFLAFFTAAGMVGCFLVLIQSFLISSYRVAVDYVNREIVLRYQFQRIHIPFADFDTREGKPDRAEAILTTSPLGRGKPAVRYLILDDVRASACYQTTTKDLSGIEDFERLKSEAEKIRDVCRGKPEEKKTHGEEDEMDKIIQTALSD